MIMLFISSGPGMMSSMMSSGGCQDLPGQPAFSSDYLSGEGEWAESRVVDSNFITLPPTVTGENLCKHFGDSFWAQSSRAFSKIWSFKLSERRFMQGMLIG